MKEEDDNDEESALLQPGGKRSGGSNSFRHLLNVILLGFSFYLIFFAFSTTQELQSSLVPGRLGFWTMGVLYASFCISSLFFASPVARALPPRWALVLGGASYIPLTAANLYPLWETMIPAAIVLGVGAGVLWTAQGAYITAAAANYARSKNQDPKASLGLFNGLFFGIFMSTQVASSLIAGLLFVYGSENENTAKNILFYIFLGVAALGVALFGALGYEETEKERQARLALAGDSELPDTLTYDPNAGAHVVKRMFNVATGNALEVIRLLRDPRMMLMVPACAYVGIEQGFVSGVFTANIVKEAKDIGWVCFVMAVYAGFDAAFGMFLGRTSDLMGKRVYPILGFAMHASFIIYYMIFDNISRISTLSDNVWILFLSGAVLGVADACWYSFPSIMMSVYFADNPQPAFGNFKFWQSAGSIFSFFLGPLVSFRVMLVILGASLLITFTSLTILDRKVAPISGHLRRHRLSSKPSNPAVDLQSLAIGNLTRGGRRRYVP